MRSLIILLFLFTAGACASSPCYIYPPRPERKGDSKPSVPCKQYICYRTPSPITVDGRIDEPAWDEAAWSDDFQDIEGSKKPAPRFRTRMKMLWDEDYFYFAAELEEPHVWAKLTERDSVIFYDNDFEIFIDPDGDTHHYYEFEMNALNTVWDLFLDKPYRDGCRPLFHWDIRGLKSGVHVQGTINRPDDTDEGWTLEVAMPWAVLKECAPGGRPPEPGDQWRVNFSRVEWRVEVKDGGYEKTINPDTGKSYPEDNWVWSPQGKVNMHMPEMWGFVQFSAREAGSGTEDFLFRREENAKWALRRVYYAQRAHFEKHGVFTDKMSDLGLDDLKLANYAWPPSIQHTWNLFEACLEQNSGKEKVCIIQDGKVWRD